MMRRTLLAAAMAAPALALLAAPASAGCTDEYVADMTTTRSYAFVGPSTADWASVDPATLKVSVDGGLILSDTANLAAIPVIIATYEANDARAHTVTYAKCV